MKRLFLLATVAVFAGCASVPLATGELDKQTKTFAATPDKAIIYLFRDSIAAAVIKVNVKLDGKLIGQTASYTYFALEVDPGNHTLESQAENVSKLELYAEAGQIYFIKQEMKFGVLFARNEIRRVDEKSGREGVSECHLIEPMK